MELLNKFAFRADTVYLASGLQKKLSIGSLVVVI